MIGATSRQVGAREHAHVLEKLTNSLEQYFLGAQIDVSGIVKECPGLEAHKRALNQEPPVEPQNSAQAAESIPVRQSSRQTSQTMTGISKHRNGHDRVRNKLRAFLDKSMRRERQYLSDEDPVLIDAQESPMEDRFPIPTALAGSLPGVYHNYLLVRPDPSLHILFASSALQHTADLRQTPLLSHISTSVNTLAGLQKAFAQAIPVTGRVVWKPALGGGPLSSHASWHSAAALGGHGVEGLGGSAAGQSQWLSATPLVGSDDRVGVWVIVIIKAPYGSAVGEMF
jgi:hypothetical protein